MMSAANTPFIWLVRLQNRLFGRARGGPAARPAFLTRQGVLPYRSAVPERIEITNPRRAFKGLRDAGRKRIF